MLSNKSADAKCEQPVLCKALTTEDKATIPLSPKIVVQVVRTSETTSMVSIIDTESNSIVNSFSREHLLQVIAIPGNLNEFIMAIQDPNDTDTQCSKLIVWNIKENEAQETYDVSFGGKISYSHLNGGIIAGKSKFQNNEVYLYDIATKGKMSRVFTHDKTILGCEFVRSDLLAIIDFDLSVHLIQLAVGNKIDCKPVGERVPGVHRIIPDPLGHYCITASRFCPGHKYFLMTLWKIGESGLHDPRVIQQGEHLRTFNYSSLYKAAFLPSGNFYFNDDDKLFQLLPDSFTTKEARVYCKDIIAMPPNKLLLCQETGWSVLKVEEDVEALRKATKKSEKGQAFCRMFQTITLAPKGVAELMLDYFDPNEVANMNEFGFFHKWNL